MRGPNPNRMPHASKDIHVGRLLRAVYQGVSMEDLVDRFGVSARSLSDIIAFHQRQRDGEKKPS